MALKQHTDKRVRFDQQVNNSRSYVLPFIAKTHAINEQTNVLEVGAAEGGVLLPFIEHGCHCVGVDLAEGRIAIANEYLEKDVKAGKAEFLTQDIYEPEFLERFKNSFDVVILKDVIEHVPEQEKFIPYLKNFLKPGGQIFFGFPPWYMPFGGHQQVAQTRYASKVPWYHILPTSLYTRLLKMAGEDPTSIKNLLEIKETQITIERFERIVKKSGLKVLNKQHYLVNPIYKYKFGLTPRKQWAPITWIPYFRDFVTTCVYYTVG